jgi:hypothetical protein
MTPGQSEAVRELLARLKLTELHHGDCVGADAEAHEIARSLGAVVIVHPPIDVSRRAFCSADKLLPPAPYLERNQAIVDSVRILVAAPAQEKEILRSGTWATVRYARRCGVPVTIVPPSGERR